MINLPPYNQGNPKWRDIEIGRFPDGTVLTMGSYGCMITSLAMALKNYAVDVDPGLLAAMLKSTGGLDQEANLKHEGIEKLYENVKFIERVYTTNSPGSSPVPKTLIGAAMERVKNILSLGQPVLLQVDNVGNDGIPDHWVVAKEARNGDFLINNPDGGTEQWFSQRYGDPAKKLYGYYSIFGPSIGYPPQSSEERQKSGLAAGHAALILRNKDVQSNARSIISDLIG